MVHVNQDFMKDVCIDDMVYKGLHVGEGDSVRILGISLLSLRSPLPWCVIGDLNDIQTVEEKKEDQGGNLLYFKAFDKQFLMLVLLIFWFKIGRHWISSTKNYEARIPKHLIPWLLKVCMCFEAHAFQNTICRVVQDLETIRRESSSLLKNLKAHDW
ncbi:hypothetical protein MTR_2g043890 [Medicago truncatula]|uniref:Uncharacterized protein n=1 Tax=Medicago truncatula TaxID=3880 RepID=A0A072VHL2_MEDTR|nr:hypothetical protein MTR_2g043890 [Medicago truncatula]